MDEDSFKENDSVEVLSSQGSSSESEEDEFLKDVARFTSTFHTTKGKMKWARTGRERRRKGKPPRYTFFLAWTKGNPMRMCLKNGVFPEDLRPSKEHPLDDKRMFINVNDIRKIRKNYFPHHITRFLEKAFQSTALEIEDSVIEVKNAGKHPQTPLVFANIYKKLNMRLSKSEVYVSFYALKNYLSSTVRKNEMSNEEMAFFTPISFVDAFIGFMNADVKHDPPVMDVTRYVRSAKELELPESSESPEEGEGAPSKEEILKCISRKQIETHLVMPVTPPEDFPLGYIDPNMVPDYVGLTFSLYEVPPTYQTVRKQWYVRNWGLEKRKKRNKNGGSGGAASTSLAWQESSMLETLYKDPNALVLARWRSAFVGYPSGASKKRRNASSSSLATDHENMIQILAIRSDDLQRSGLCHSVNESMRIVTERLLGSSDQEAISYLFPTMCRNDVVFLKSYFGSHVGGKRREDMPEEVRAPFQNRRHFHIPKSIFAPAGKRETVEQQRERMKKFSDTVREIKNCITYTEHLRLLSDQDRNSIAEYSYRKMKQAKDRKRAERLMKRGNLSELVEMQSSTSYTDSETSRSAYDDNDEEGEEEEYGSLGEKEEGASATRGTKRRATGEKGKHTYVESASDEEYSLRTYMRYMRNVPPFAVRFLKQTKALVPDPLIKGYTNYPYVSMNMFEHQFHIKGSSTHTSYEAYELPRETYRLIPIWLFPLVLDVSTNDLLAYMMHGHDLYGLCKKKLRESLRKMISVYGSEKRRYRLKDTDRVSPFSRLNLNDMMRGCQKLLETSDLWNDAFRKDSILSMQRNLEAVMKQVYALRVYVQQRFDIQDDQNEYFRQMMSLPSHNPHALAEAPYPFSVCEDEEGEEEGSDDHGLKAVYTPPPPRPSHRVMAKTNIEALYLSSTECSSSLSAENSNCGVYEDEEEEFIEEDEGSVSGSKGEVDKDGYFSVPCSSE